MAARRAAICKRYLFQQIENQHVVGHSIERWLFANHFSSRCIAIGDFPRTPCGGTHVEHIGKLREIRAMIFPENAEGSGVRRRSRKNANDLEPDPRDHLAQHDRRRRVHARGPQRKAQTDPCAEGLAGEPVAISEFAAASRISHRREENFPKASPPNILIVIRLCSPRP